MSSKLFRAMGIRPEATSRRPGANVRFANRWLKSAILISAHSSLEVVHFSYWRVLPINVVAESFGKLNQAWSMCEENIAYLRMIGPAVVPFGLRERPVSCFADRANQGRFWHSNKR